LETQLLDHARPAAWSKVLLIQRLLAHYRAVVWIDASATGEFAPTRADASLPIVDAAVRQWIILSGRAAFERFPDLLHVLEGRSS